MAKVQQKSKKISAFGGIFFVLDRFDRILSSVIDSHLGLRSKLIGYQYSEIIRAIFSVILQSVVIWSRSFGQNQFRERGHCSLYININIYIIVADFDSLFSILTKMTMTTLTATRPRFFYGLKGPIGLAAKAALAPSLSL